MLVGRDGINIILDEKDQVVAIEPCGEVDLSQPPFLIPHIRLLYNGVIVEGWECVWKPYKLDGIDILAKTLAEGKSIRLVDILEVRKRVFENQHPDIHN